MEDHSKLHNKPSTPRSYQHQIDSFVIPAFGSKKVHEVTREDITTLTKRMEKSPIQAKRTLACLFRNSGSQQAAQSGILLPRMAAHPRARLRSEGRHPRHSSPRCHL